MIAGSPRTGIALALAIAMAIALAFAAGADAQVPTLDRVDDLLAAGDYAGATATLERWWSARETFDVPGSDRARALMLRARLAPDPRTAEPDYLAIVLGYPTSPQAPEALLRLGQGLLTAGEATRAAAYLQRLVSDYPGRPERGPALLWLARAHTAARRNADACTAAREGLADVRDPDLTAMLRVEEAAACAIAAGDRPAGQPATQPDQRPATQPPTPTQRPAQTRPQTPAPGGTAAPAATGGYAVQTGAFRYQRSVDEIVPRLRAAGHEPRVVLVPANELMRVRVGRFATAEEAARLVAALRRQGFDAVVVSDVERERRP